ncbi:MAG TPA: diguanylate cyclase [Thermodesulfovibrionales bacterium]|nr:diguanylate cyclase [Thermodesulfovibrionales bacterium]
MSESKILLVEDDKVQGKATKNYLETSGYEVIFVEDGKSAIKAVKTQEIDLVVLDLILPDMNGNEVCRWLKLNQDTRGIPIIMLTAQGSTTDKVASLTAGADDHLTKPFNESELGARIYACLRTKALQDELRDKNRQLEEVLSRVEVLAITDPLTQLYNRRHFETLIESEFATTTRYKSPTSCLMIDVDFFKQVNDQFGHRAGDTVLKEIAQIIKNCLRKVDTVARWGGEEFVVLLPRTKKEDSLIAAERILNSISEHSFSGVDRQITVSIGVASMPDPSIDSSEKLVDASDAALYEAKGSGRNRIIVAH